MKNNLQLIFHNTTIIGSKNKFGKNINIGCYCIIGNNVSIGSNVKIGNNVIIHDDTVIENDVSICDNSILGKLPMKVSSSALKVNESLAQCRVSKGSIVGTAAIIYRGCFIGRNCLVADLATVRENVKIGDNTIIGRGCAVENDCIIGNNCKLETNAYITAYSQLEDYVFIAPGVVTSNDNYAARLKCKDYSFKGVTVKKGGRIGAQATILPGKVINEDGFAAAGSIVTKDIEAAKIYCGNPAVYLKDVPYDQLIDNQ